MGWWSDLLGTTKRTLGIGDLTDNTMSIQANNADVNKPTIRYNHTTNKWEISHDGTTFAETILIGGAPSFASASVTADNDSGSAGKLSNVYFGTEATIDPSGKPNGSLYFQYTP